MLRAETVQRILDSRFVVIIRASGIPDVRKLVDALMYGGASVLEISFNTPGAADLIGRITDEYGPELLCGAGTVMDEPMAASAIDAGAKFVISPVFNPSMIDVCVRRGIPAMPGVFTPTEAYNAYCAGASFLKIFPAGVNGPNFIKAIKTVMPFLPFVAVGGVTSENAVEFLSAGASAVAVGSALVNDSLLETGDYPAITRNTRKFMELLNNV